MKYLSVCNVQNDIEIYTFPAEEKHHAHLIWLSHHRRRGLSEMITPHISISSEEDKDAHFSVIHQLHGQSLEGRKIISCMHIVQQRIYIYISLYTIVT